MIDTIPDYISREQAARLLSLSTQRISQLAAEGVLKRDQNGLYASGGIGAKYAEYLVERRVTKRKDAVTEERQKLQADKLRRQLAREDRDIIDLDEALETTDQMTGRFLAAISSLPARLARDITERRRIEDVCDAVRNELSEGFARDREELQEGSKATRR